MANRRNREANMLAGQASQDATKVIKEQIRPSEKGIVDLYIMTTSKINDFKFDEAGRKITFTVTGNDGAEGEEADLHGIS